jgi:adenosylcobinamide-GDP ribazoletransferase
MQKFPFTWGEEFLTAACFLTRLPWRRLHALSPAGGLAETSWAFPLVGIVVGLLGGIAYWVATSLGVPSLPAGLLALATTMLATGGLHEDGLADSADGLGGNAAAEKLAIMRDSRTGAYGVLALILSVGLRASAIAAIGSAAIVIPSLIAAHALARGFLPFVLRYLAPAREDGLGAEAGRPEQRIAALSAGIAIVVVLLALGLRAGIVAVLGAAAVMIGLAWLAQRQIGGQTGDVLGAIEQAGEIVVLLVAAAWAA